MVGVVLTEQEKSLLRSLIGKRLLKLRHDQLEKFGGSEVYGRVELFFENSMIAIDYDYTPYHLFGSMDDSIQNFKYIR